MAVFGIWLIQGLDGAPRRWAVLPSNYDTLTRVSLPLVFVLAAAQGLFFWNVLQTLRGKGGVATFDERGIPRPSERKSEWSVRGSRGRARAGRSSSSLRRRCRSRVSGRPGARQGRRRQTHRPRRARRRRPRRRGSGRGREGLRERRLRRLPHARRPPDSTGNVGPVLDGANLCAAVVAARVEAGKGAMPPFAGRLSDAADRGRRRLRPRVVAEVAFPKSPACRAFLFAGRERRASRPAATPTRQAWTATSPSRSVCPPRWCSSRHADCTTRQ